MAGRQWRLPAERTKNKKAHQVPLSDLALECLGEPRAGFIFSNNGGSTPITSWSKSTAKLREIVTRELPDAVANWTLHDLRRTVASGLAQLGAARETISRVLNHIDGTTTGIYDRYSRSDEVRRVLDAWARRLERIVSGSESGKVIELHGQRP
jgi:integrase